MEDSKALSLLRETITKTNARKLPWAETAQEDVFVVPMKGKYTLRAYGFTIYDGEGQKTGPPSLTLYEGDKMVIDINADVPDVAERELRELYETVRRQALRLDEKLDDAIDFLKNL
jgi:hypothetical protein